MNKSSQEVILLVTVVALIGLALGGMFVVRQKMQTTTGFSDTSLTQETVPSETNQPVYSTSSPSASTQLDSEIQIMDSKMVDLNNDNKNVDSGLNDQAIDVQY